MLLQNVNSLYDHLKEWVKWLLPSATSIRLKSIKPEQRLVQKKHSIFLLIME